MDKGTFKWILGLACALLLMAALVLWKARTERMRTFEKRKVTEVETNTKLVRFPAWDEETQVMTVYFESQPRMDYKGVPKSVFEAMDAAEDKDAFYLEHIKDKYAY